MTDVSALWRIAKDVSRASSAVSSEAETTNCTSKVLEPHEEVVARSLAVDHHHRSVLVELLGGDRLDTAEEPVVAKDLADRDQADPADREELLARRSATRLVVELRRVRLQEADIRQVRGRERVIEHVGGPHLAVADLAGGHGVGADVDRGEVGVLDVGGLHLVVDDVGRANLILARQRAVDGAGRSDQCDEQRD
ncbi:MAG TPA: hypothetical protein VE401_05345 [Solirubrobacterales bacterium]|nr:hypothetical protein [Solirubrobacterales bacterium]